jgi:glucose-6-phosphate 1-dehydrogenase
MSARIISPKVGRRTFQAFLADGGFSTDGPGNLPGVLDDARKSLRADSQLIYYLTVPPVAFAELTKALGQHGSPRALASCT